MLIMAMMAIVPIEPLLAFAAVRTRYRSPPRSSTTTIGGHVVRTTRGASPRNNWERAATNCILLASGSSSDDGPEPEGPGPGDDDDDDEDDGWGDDERVTVAETTAGSYAAETTASAPPPPPSDRISKSTELARLKNDRALLKRQRSGIGPTVDHLADKSSGGGGANGGGIEKRDMFIPVVTLISIVGFTGLYGYEMLRLYSRGELYLPWES